MEISIDDFLKIGDTNNDPEIAYNRGKWLKEKGRYIDAINDFSDAINWKKNFMEALIERSLCYYALNKYDLAIEDATKAIGLTTNINNFKRSVYEATYLEVRSRIHIAKNDLVNAFKDLNKSCEITFTNAFDARGNLYLKINNYGEALKDFEQMSIIYPNNGNYLFKIGYCYFKMNKKDKAVEYFKIASRFGSKEASSLLKSVNNK